MTNKQSRPELHPAVTFIKKHYYLLLIVIPLVVFSASLRNGFVYLDDDILVLDNQAKITHLKDLGNIFHSDAFLNNTSPYYRPMLNVSLMLDAQVAGTSPGFYHFMSLLLHILCCLGLFWLLQLLGLRREKSFAGVLIFAVHPVVASAVFWIPARGDLLAALFGILFLASGIRFSQSRKPAWLILSVFAFSIALFSKESAVVLPFLLGLYLLLTRQVRWQSLLLFCGPVLVTAGWFYLRSISVRNIGAEQMGFASIIKNLPFPFEILSRFFVPFFLPVVPVFSVLFTLAGIVVFLSIPVWFIFSKTRSGNLFLFGTFWFLAFLLPNMFVWLVTSPDSYEYLVHRAYFPLAGLLVMILALVPDRIVNVGDRRVTVVFAILILVLSVASVAQGMKYRDAPSFWNSAIRDNPSRAWYYHFLGRYYFKQQDYVNFEHYTRLAIARKADPRFLYNLGLVSFLGKKEYDTANVYFLRARAMGFNEPEANKNYFDFCVESARNYFEKGEYRKAVDRCMTGVQVNPTNAIATYNLGLYLAYAGETKSAATWWYRTLLLDPQLKETYLSLYYYYLNNTTLSDSVSYYAGEYRKRGGVLETPVK